MAATGIAPYALLEPFPAHRADGWLRSAREELPWRCESVRLFGRVHPQPRLTAFVGAPGSVYRYSGIEHHGRGWPAWVRPLVAALAARGVHANALLANLYRDGADCVGWHSDDEGDLLAGSAIATVCLGTPRRVRFRRRSPEGAWELRALTVGHGTVYLMSVASQRYWQHAVPRTRRPVGERIALTFRTVRRAAG